MILYGLLVMIQYQAKCNSPLYQSSQAIKFAFTFVYFLLQTWPGLCLFSNSEYRKVFTPIYQSLHLKTWPFFSTKMCRYGLRDPIWQQIGSKTLTMPTKLDVLILTESQHWFGTNHYGIQTIKMVLIIFECLWFFGIGGYKQFWTVLYFDHWSVA